MFERIAHVHISIPVTVSFDEKPGPAEFRRAALENFLDHPVIRDPNYRSLLDDFVAGIVEEPLPDNRSCAPDVIRLAEVVFDITDTAARIYPEDSRKRFQTIYSWAQEFEAAHPKLWGEGNYPDECGDDYVLAVEAFTEKKLKEVF